MHMKTSVDSANSILNRLFFQKITNQLQIYPIILKLCGTRKGLYHEPDEAGLGEHYGKAKCTLCWRYVNQCLDTEVKVSQRYKRGGEGTTQT